MDMPRWSHLRSSHTDGCNKSHFQGWAPELLVLCHVQTGLSMIATPKL